MKGCIITNKKGRYTTTNIKYLREHVTTNGCGTKATKWIPEVYFHQSCNTHDYMVSGYRNNLLDCHWTDPHLAFRHNMLKDADFWCDSWFSRSGVKALANIYFLGVVLAEPFNRLLSS